MTSLSKRTLTVLFLYEGVLAELRHHRHWQGALARLARGCQLPALPSVLPQAGLVLGGTMDLQVGTAATYMLT